MLNTTKLSSQIWKKYQKATKGEQQVFERSNENTDLPSINSITLKEKAPVAGDASMNSSLGRFANKSTTARDTIFGKFNDKSQR